jgi:hypothetical protein
MLAKILLLTSATLLLAGCGGGSSSLNTQITSISGTVMDGYISGAKVCLDINANLICDITEPSGTSKSDGTYTLNIVPGTDLSKLHVIAVVDQNTTDADTKTAPAKNYVLLAPATTAAVVTPLTTLVSNNMIAVPGLTVAEAQNQTVATLQLASSNALTKDYIKENDPATHNLAKLTADLLGQATASVNTAADITASSTEKDKKAALSASIAQAQAVASKYALNTSKTTTDAQASTLRALATSEVQSNIASNQTNIKTEVQLGVANAASIVEILKVGLFNAWQSTTSGLSYERIYSPSSGVVMTDNWYSTKTAQNWTTDTTTNYIANQATGAWISVKDGANGTFTTASDGLSGTYIADKTGETMKVVFTILDVSAKKASDLPYVLKNTFCPTGVGCKYVDFVFPTGSQLIRGNFYRDQEQYQASACASCSVTRYDAVSKTQVEFTTLADAIAWADGSSSGHYFFIQSAVVSFAPTSATTGTVNFMSPSAQTNGKYTTSIGSGNYNITTVANQKVMRIKVTSETTPGTLSSTSNNGGLSDVIVVEINNRVLGGKYSPKGFQEESYMRPDSNKTALDAFLKAQGYPVSK